MTSGTATVDRAREHEHRRYRSFVQWLDNQALLVTAMCAVAIFSVAKLPLHLTQDSWLALVGGRYVAAHGIPHHDTLFFVTHGARWIDQQWLAQLLIYDLYRVGGLVLYELFYVVLMMAGVGLAIAAGRALGGSERHLLWVLPLAGALYFAGSFNIRTQGFALPLFAATLWLLAREARGAGDRRVYWVLPLLVLWSNLHGSATLGVALTMLCGAVLIGQDLAAKGWRRPWQTVRARGLVLLIAAPICLLITPYGLEILPYYRATLLNPAFAQVVTEWGPITTVQILAVPFFILAAASLWLMGRCGRRMPVFDQLALVVLGAGAVFAIRNIPWYGMGAIMLMPAALTTWLGRPSASARRTRINLTMVGVSALALVAITIGVAARPASWLESRYDARAGNVVAQIAQQRPGVRIYADNRFADWLLWHHPTLAGRIDYDIRFELLTSSQLQRIVDVTALPKPGEPSMLNRYGVLVLDPMSSDADKRILARPGTHVLIRNSRVIVATWKPAL